MYWRLTVIAMVWLLQGCALLQHKEPPVAVVAPPKPSPMEVVILVSEDNAAYSNVAKAIASKLGSRSFMRYMSGSQIQDIRMLAAYRNDRHKQFVSIGLNASIAAKTLTDSPVVFCQVFNYQDYELVSARHKGVSMIPSMSKTFGAWRALAPDITDVGVISGPNFEDVIQKAQAAARNFGITLHHVTVNSDKEYLYAYKQMADKVQGYWLLPDNRVLSGNILHDVMIFSVRNSKQVAVFSDNAKFRDEMLNLGGLFSTGSDYRDIAQQVLDRLEQSRNSNTIAGDDIVYPDKLILRINPVMSQRLNLKIPARYLKYQNAN
jgi:ABC-type uncharacterized transport system substrate-binding protein